MRSVEDDQGVFLRIATNGLFMMTWVEVAVSNRPCQANLELRIVCQTQPRKHVGCLGGKKKKGRKSG